MVHTLNNPLVVCEHCDAVFQKAPLPAGASARCLRCDSELYHHGRANLQTLMALALAALLSFVIANACPIVEIELRGAGNHSQTTLWGAVLATWQSGVGTLAVLTWACAFFFPLAEISACLYISLPLLLRRTPPGFRQALHLLQQLQPWSMMEVFMLGTFVAVVKLGGYAYVVVDAGLWAFAALTLLLTLLSTFDLHGLWSRLDGEWESAA